MVEFYSLVLPSRSFCLCLCLCLELYAKTPPTERVARMVVQHCRCEPPLRRPSLPLVLPTVVEACIDDSIAGFADVRSASTVRLLSSLPAAHNRELKALMRRIQRLVGSSVAVSAEVTPLLPMVDGTAVALLLLAGTTDEEPLQHQFGVRNRTRMALSAVAEHGRRHCESGSSRGTEHYTLLSRTSFVFAGSPSVAGAHSAMATLEQLARPTRQPGSRKPGGRPRPLPPVFVADEPAYGWRGFHLDVARHFFKVPTVETLVRRLARLKFNVLHTQLAQDAAPAAPRGPTPSHQAVVGRKARGSAMARPHALGSVTVAPSWLPGCL